MWGGSAAKQEEDGCLTSTLAYSPLAVFNSHTSLPLKSHVESAFVLSNVYENGLACEPFQPNRRRALQVLLACSRGASNAELLLQIGRMYRSGYGNNSGRPDESDYILAFS